MLWRNIFATAMISLALPFSVYAAELDSYSNDNLETAYELSNNQSVSQKLAHRPFANNRNNRNDREDRMTRLLEQLDLTPEQSQQIETIKQQSKADTESLRQELQQAHEQMRSLMVADTNSNELRQQHQQLQTLHQQLGTQRFETMLQVREVLTPEQRSQMAELMGQHRGRRGF